MVKKVCPNNKFNVLNYCTSWTTILAFLLLITLIIIYFLITANKYNKSLFISSLNNDSNDDEYNNYYYNNDNNKYVNDNKKYINGNKKVEYRGDNLMYRDSIDINVNINDKSEKINKNLERIINPMLPPERSYTNTYGVPINIPSRGIDQPYQQIGILYKDDIQDINKQIGNNTDNNILPLFGKPTYSGSNKWNYYTSSDKYHSYKIPFHINGKKSTDEYGCNELYNGDSINIPSYNGNFKVEIYDYDKPKYIPFT